MYSILITLLVSCLTLFIFDFNEKTLQFTGVLMQIIGYIINVLKLKNIEKIFPIPSIFSLFKLFLNKIRSKYNSNQNIGNGIIVAPMPEVRIFASHNIPEDASLDEKLQFVYEHLKIMIISCEEKIETVKQLQKEYRSSVVNRVGYLYSEIVRVENMIRGVSSDGIYLEYSGVAFFIIGTIISVYSSQLLHLINSIKLIF